MVPVALCSCPTVTSVSVTARALGAAGAAAGVASTAAVDFACASVAVSVFPQPHTLIQTAKASLLKVVESPPDATCASRVLAMLMPPGAVLETKRSSNDSQRLRLLADLHLRIPY